MVKRPPARLCSLRDSVREISVTLGIAQMALRFLRVVYAIEFLMALVAVLEVWREVGGQSHLDLMPWFFKFILAVGLAGAIVKLTSVSLAERGRRTWIWSAIVALFLVAAGLITYYYHLNEPLDGDEETTSFTAVIGLAHNARQS